MTDTEWTLERISGVFDETAGCGCCGDSFRCPCGDDSAWAVGEHLSHLLADHDASIRAAERERIAQAIEAIPLEVHDSFGPVLLSGRDVQRHAARIARTQGDLA